MKSAEKVILTKKASIKEALEIIDHGDLRIALVVDSNHKLIGTIADGDIRRAFLKGAKLNDSIKGFIQNNFICAKIGDSKEDIINLARKHNIYQIPVVDKKYNLLGIEEFSDLIDDKSHENKVVLMVGGLGKRLMPLTQETPKPMLKIGGVPLLETIIENFSKYGFKNFILSLNYKAQMVVDYFGDGGKFGVSIEYIYETKRMGTAGSLSLMKDKLAGNFFVMNGDLLTKVNFEHLVNYHLEQKSAATMCVRKYDLDIPYGVVNIEHYHVTSIEEKPSHQFFVNAGIYVLNSSVLDYIPEDKFFDMPTLFEILIKNSNDVSSFPIREYWLDIGKFEEFEKANNEYKHFFD
jgi:dTDP-glucose pyrophosphorylase/predicted transcriptional regulator